MTEENEDTHRIDPLSIGEDMTPLACCSVLQLATEIMKRGTTILGIVTEDHGKEERHLFAIDHYAEHVSLMDLLTDVCDHAAEVDLMEDEFDGDDDDELDEPDDYNSEWSEAGDQADAEDDDEDD